MSFEIRKIRNFAIKKTKERKMYEKIKDEVVRKKMEVSIS